MRVIMTITERSLGAGVLGRCADTRQVLLAPLWNRLFAHPWWWRRKLRLRGGAKHLNSGHLRKTCCPHFTDVENEAPGRGVEGRCVGVLWEGG